MYKLFISIFLILFSFQTLASIQEAVSYNVSGKHLKSKKPLQSCAVLIFQPDSSTAPLQLKFRFSDEKLDSVNDFFSRGWETYGMEFTIGYSIPLIEGESDRLLYSNETIIHQTIHKYSARVGISPDLSVLGEVVMLAHGREIARCSFN